MHPHPLANFLGKFGQNLGQFEQNLGNLGEIWNWVKVWVTDQFQKHQNLS